MRKIAIVAFSQNSRDDAPFADESFEIWGMNNLHAVLPEKRFTRWYEIHPKDFIYANNKNLWSDHLEWLKKATVPVYMLQHFPEFPTSEAYPIDDIREMMREQLGFAPTEDNYLHSTPAMALAHAVLEGVDHVEIYGCDMVVEGEYGFQRANMEAWITLARQQVGPAGKKVTVKVADRCALMKGMGLYAYDGNTYGFVLNLEENLRLLMNEATERKIAADNERARKQIEMNTFDGARQSLETVLKLVKQMQRGYAP